MTTTDDAYGIAACAAASSGSRSASSSAVTNAGVATTTPSAVDHLSVDELDPVALRATRHACCGPAEKQLGALERVDDSRRRASPSRREATRTAAARSAAAPTGRAGCCRARAPAPAAAGTSRGARADRRRRRRSRSSAARRAPRTPRDRNGARRTTRPTRPRRPQPAGRPARRRSARLPSGDRSSLRSSASRFVGIIPVRPSGSGCRSSPRRTNVWWCSGRRAMSSSPRPSSSTSPTPRSLRDRKLSGAASITNPSTCSVRSFPPSIASLSTRTISAAGATSSRRRAAASPAIPPPTTTTFTPPALPPARASRARGPARRARR